MVYCSVLERKKKIKSASKDVVYWVLPQSSFFLSFLSFFFFFLFFTIMIGNVLVKNKNNLKKIAGR